MGYGIEKEEMGILFLALLLTPCVTLEMILPLPMPQFSYL